MPGQFDYYVLSLSWSPSFCATAAERGRGRAGNAQCGARPYSFVVHGLWPQYDKGFPENCQLPAPRLDRSTVAWMLDLMPAPHLIFNECDRHGTCSGQTHILPPVPGSRRLGGEQQCNQRRTARPARQ
jgi:ribonuclease T2